LYEAKQLWKQTAKPLYGWQLTVRDTLERLICDRVFKHFPCKAEKVYRREKFWSVYWSPSLL